MFVYLSPNPIVGLVVIFPKITGVQCPDGKLIKWSNRMAESGLPAEYQVVWLGILWNMTNGLRTPSQDEIELAKVHCVELDRFIKTGTVLSDEAYELAKKLANKY